MEEKFFKLVRAVQELSMTRDISTVMAIVRSVARELTGADGATFVFLEDGMCYYADEEAIAPLWKGQRFDVNTCVSGWVIKNKKPLVIRDVFADDRIPKEIYRPTFVKSLAMVPIRTMNPIGAIGNYWAFEYQPPQSDIDLLQSLADITAVTLENVHVYKDLERIVRVRTAQLEDANNLLSATNAELEALAYSLSHDLRSPLRNISMVLNRLIDDHHPSPEDPARPLADKIFRRISGMQLLITDLLTLFESGTKAPNFSLVNTREIVERVFSDLKEMENGRNITLEVEALPDACVDKTQITLVWQNLIGNAIKYTARRSEAFIRIGASQNEREVTFSISDNGAGFDMKHADKLFVPFQRLHGQADFEGTGVGLAIVNKIVSKHNGRVWADGKPDEGATFYFSIANRPGPGRMEASTASTRSGYDTHDL